jgi:hypothetical protein
MWAASKVCLFVNSAAINMVCKWLYHILEHIPSDICLGVVLLDHIVVLFLVFWGTSILLSIAAVLIHIPTKNVEVFFSLHILTSIYVFLMIAILTGVRLDLSVVLICICFMAKDLNISSCVYWPFLLLLFENCLFSSFAHLLSGFLILGEFSFLSSWYNSGY